VIVKKPLAAIGRGNEFSAGDVNGPEVRRGDLPQKRRGNKQE